MCGRDLIYFLILINDKISCFLCGFGVLPDVEFVMFCAGERTTRERGRKLWQDPAPIFDC